DVAFAAHFSGRDGFPGADGANGFDGTAGTPGSIDLSNPSAGGNGSDGSDGGDGFSGGDGARGQAIHVWVTLRAGTHPLLQVRVASITREQFFLVDPEGGTLSIDANGGAGGRGGSGGRGGHGGAGGIGWPSGLSGHDGRNGSDGHRGNDGAAGTIAMEVDARAQPGIMPRIIAYLTSMWLPKAPARRMRSTRSHPKRSMSSATPARSAALASWIARTSFWVIESAGVPRCTT